MRDQIRLLTLDEMEWEVAPKPFEPPDSAWAFRHKPSGLVLVDEKWRVRVPRPPALRGKRITLYARVEVPRTWWDKLFFRTRHHWRVIKLDEEEIMAMCRMHSLLVSGYESNTGSRLLKEAFRMKPEDYKMLKEKTSHEE